VIGNSRGVCAWGAITSVLRLGRDSRVVTHVWQLVVRKLVNYLGGSAGLVGEIVRWNDTPGRIKEQVVAAQRAASRAR
jgi:hypothetical protein